MNNVEWSVLHERAYIDPYGVLRLEFNDQAIGGVSIPLGYFTFKGAL